MQLIQIRYSLRSLARAPVFTFVVIMVLSLGIAVNTTAFTVIDQLVFNPLPYKDPSQLVMVWERNPSLAEPAGSRVPAAWSNFVEWRAQSKSFQMIEAFERAGYNLTGAATPEHLTAARATGGYLQMLGISAKRGRILTPRDCEPGADAVAVVTSAFEKAHFANEDAVGRKLLLDGLPYTIVGVLPSNFHLPLLFRGSYEYQPDIWVPRPATTPADVSKFRRLFVSARLKENSSLAEARVEMAAIAKRLEQLDPELNQAYDINLVPLRVENTDPDFERAVYVLWAGAFVVLLLGCANLASLMLVRIMSKQRDFAIMKALGAPRSALITNILTEGTLLTVVALTLAVLCSYAGVGWIRAMKPGDMAGAERLNLSTNGLIFATCAFIFCAFTFAFLPGWLSTRHSLHAILRRPTGGVAEGMGGVIRRALVCGEVAIALALAIGAVLLVRSFRELLLVDPGFRTQNVVTARINLTYPRYPDANDRAVVCERLLDRVRELPLVQSASLADNFPLYSIHYTSFEIEGRAIARPESAPTADYANVTADFFQAMGTPLRRGRLFTPEDMEENTEKVVIVNESLAHKLWPNEDPIGSYLRAVIPHQKPGPWRRVIGVVGDFRQLNIDAPPRPEMFWPARGYSEMTLAMRTSIDPDALIQSLRQTVSAVDKELPVSDVQTLRQMVDHSIAQRRFNTFLLSGFAGLGIVLALVGVYGLISYIVSSQNRNIGIRTVLGARRRHILGALIRQIVPFAAAGVLLGLVLSFIARKLIANLLFSVSALDPVAYLSSPAILMVLILVACVRPLWLATRVEPAKILRDE